MKDVLLDSPVVAQKDRISIDISDLKQELETCRSDAAWAELPMSAKIRVLVKERLEEMKRTKSEPEPELGE